ncbi:MAG: hypothetical protein WBE40_00840 [Thermoplasmata archaeon]
MPALSSIADFDRIFDVYHGDAKLDGPSPFLRAMNMVSGGESRLLSRDALGYVVNDYLRRWGGMGRVLGGCVSASEPDSVRDSLADSLEYRWKTIRALRGCSIQELRAGDATVAEISELFDDLLDKWTIPPAVAGRASPKTHVGVAKVLAVVVPSLCVIWDNVYVLKGGLRSASEDSRTPIFRPSADGVGYSGYLVEKASQLRATAENESLTPAKLVQTVERTHSARLASVGGGTSEQYFEPITKILDEANYREQLSVRG